MRLPVTTPPGALPSQRSTALQIPALSLQPDFFPGVLEVSGPSCTLGDRLGVGASLGGWLSVVAFLVLRQLLDTNRAGEGSVPVEWTEGGSLRAFGKRLPPFVEHWAHLQIWQGPSRRGFWELLQAGGAPTLRLAIPGVLTLDLEVRRQQPDVRDSYVARVSVIELHHHRVQVFFIARSTCNGAYPRYVASTAQQKAGEGRRATGVPSRVPLQPYYAGSPDKPTLLPLATWYHSHGSHIQADTRPSLPTHTHWGQRHPCTIPPQECLTDFCPSAPFICRPIVFPPRGPYMPRFV